MAIYLQVQSFVNNAFSETDRAAVLTSVAPDRGGATAVQAGERNSHDISDRGVVVITPTGRNTLSAIFLLSAHCY